MTAPTRPELSAFLLDLAKTIGNSPCVVSQRGILLRPVVPATALDMLKAAAKELGVEGRG